MLSSIFQSSGIQERDGLDPEKNAGNTAPLPVSFMAPIPAPVKQNMPYNQRFPQKRILALSAVQLALAILAIITQVIISHPRIQVIYTAGLWCGVLFASSGLLGVIASTRPSFGVILTFMVFAIISAAFCFTVLISGYGSWGYGNWRMDKGFCAGLIIQFIVSLIQAAAAIIAAGITCGTVCNFSRTTGESSAVYYNGRGKIDPKIAVDQHLTMPDQPPGYITITISQIKADAASVGATTFPIGLMIPGDTKIDATDKLPPPNYDSVAKMEENKEDANGSKYQRF